MRRYEIVCETKPNSIGSANACKVKTMGMSDSVPFAMSAAKAATDVLAVPITKATSNALSGIPCDIAVAW